MKLNSEYYITKNGVVRTNPGVMPYEVLMSINRAWGCIKEGRYTIKTIK